MVSATRHDLERSFPEAQGIASSAVLEFVEALESQVDEIHSFMLLRQGRVVAEGWWSPYKREYPHMMFSLSKSFTSTAVGFAVAEGHFTVDDLVLSFFPDETPDNVNDHLAGMRVRHLLSMSTGHEDDTFPPMMEREDGNWTQAFFDVPVLHEPGTHFLYNTGATYLLSAIVQKTTGMKLIDYLTPRLFEPLGIENARWDESPQGFNLGGTGLLIKTEDIARLGQLYLQKGRWQGEQILPEAWVEEATRFHVSNGDDPASDWAQGYGYQFWRCRHDNYRGDGAFGQYCIVMPEQHAVLAMTSGVSDMQKPLDLVWEILLPAMQSEALPDNAAAYDALTNKLSSLDIAPLAGQATVAITSQVSGRTYAVDANERNIETITMNFDELGCTLNIKTPKIDETMRYSSGEWTQGQTSLFDDRRFSGPQNMMVSGAWTADDTYTTIVRLVETPFYLTTTYRFAGDDLDIVAKVNVGFGDNEPQRMTAHCVENPVDES